MKKILLVMLMVLFTATSAFCGEFEDALKMAEQGHAGAQHNLGFVYAEGQGVTQDLKLAYVWSSLAASQGKGINNRDVVAKMLTPQQLSEAQDEAAKLQSQIVNQSETKD